MFTRVLFATTLLLASAAHAEPVWINTFGPQSTDEVSVIVVTQNISGKADPSDLCAMDGIVLKTIVKRALVNAGIRVTDRHVDGRQIIHFVRLEAHSLLNNLQTGVATGCTGHLRLVFHYLLPEEAKYLEPRLTSQVAMFSDDLRNFPQASEYMARQVAQKIAAKIVKDRPVGSAH